MRPLFESEVIIFSDIGMHSSQLYSLNLFQVNNVLAIFVFFQLDFQVNNSDNFLRCFFFAAKSWLKSTESECNYHYSLVNILYKECLYLLYHKILKVGGGVKECSNDNTVTARMNSKIFQVGF